ncbi:MAG: hypothetical protein K8J08_08070 [Thermoanaerobaculia bacterium]|nr:hypothetical protein [Thermoanaerobaculia bacterium]
MKIKTLSLGSSLGLLLIPALALSFTSTLGAQASNLTLETETETETGAEAETIDLWSAWTENRFVQTPAPCLKHEELVTSLDALHRRHPDAIALQEIGRSVQGRAIQMMTLGQGAHRVLLWSQMHGDEPSATPALLDIAHYLAANSERPEVARILSELTLLMIPMLNPDGAEVYQRRNAQVIDVNRDALNLATPEGRILERIRKQYEPMLGFNLHDQNRRHTVGETGVLASNALLAVTGDADNTLTPGRLLAKKACSAIVEALAPYRPGGMARYDETWSPRSFGDNITAWGTPVVLIESGAVLPGTSFDELTRLNFVAILTVLHDLAHGTLEGHDPEIYQNLPEDVLGPFTDVALRGGSIWQPGSGEPYRSDLTFDVQRSDRQAAGCAPDEEIGSAITEIGDGRRRVASTEIDAADQLIVPLLRGRIDGWEGSNWFQPQYLRVLASAGIGEIAWMVPENRRAAAELLLREVDTAGLRVSAVTDGTNVPWLDLQDTPPALAALGAGASWEDRLRLVLAPLALDPLLAMSAADLQVALWGEVPPQTPPLRPGAVASFLVLDAGSDGVSLGESKLRSVWLNGQPIPGI